MTDRSDDEAHLRERGLTQESVFRGNLLKIRVDTVCLPNGEMATREIVEHPGAAAMVPLDAQGHVVLVRQFRYACGRVTLEIPAGTLGWGETPEQAADRELIEEIGMKSARLELLGECMVAPGYSTERICIFLARDLAPEPGQTMPDEFLEVVQIPLQQAIAMAKDGRIKDAKSVIGLLWAEERLSKG